MSSHLFWAPRHTASLSGRMSTSVGALKPALAAAEIHQTPQPARAVAVNILGHMSVCGKNLYCGSAQWYKLTSFIVIAQHDLCEIARFQQTC